MAGGRKREYLFVDGYNIIFAWDYLSKVAQSSMEDARRLLLDELSDYQGFSGYETIVVFDAHNVKDNLGSIEKHDALTVVFTKEYETADNYIERCANALSKDFRVKVATNDNLEQVIVMGKGAVRISATDLKEELKASKAVQRAEYIDRKPIKRNMLFDNLDNNLKKRLERMIRQEGES